MLASGLWLAGGLIAVGGPPVAAATPAAGTDAAGVTWLCRPGLPRDPCLFPEGAVSVAANGAKTVLPAPPASQPAFDCFYIYPTVTASAATSNTGTAVTLAAEAAAVAQASRFSQVCNVWAPTYRQRTSASLNKGLGNDPTADRISYDSLLTGWQDYLAHDNDGRPVIFIGHSQGAANLIKLLRSQVDDDAALRSRMVAALILGGNVQVPVGKTVGGTFANIPACTADGPDRLRHRLLVVLVHAPGRLALRAPRSGSQPAIGPADPQGPRGALHEPRRAGPDDVDRWGAPDAVLHLQVAPRRGALGDLPRPLHGHM